MFSVCPILPHRYLHSFPTRRSSDLIAPYAVLSNAVLNIRHEYAGWLPRAIVNAGLNHLPAVLNVEPGELDRSEEHTSELQSPYDLVCRLLLEIKNVATLIEIRTLLR